jgi:hypothetical protein
VKVESQERKHVEVGQKPAFQFDISENAAHETGSLSSLNEQKLEAFASNFF